VAQTRFRIVLSVEVDPDDWAAAYGDHPTAEIVREHVAADIRQSAAAQDGAIREVLIK
jgi:hypothetical protein